MSGLVPIGRFDFRYLVGHVKPDQKLPMDFTRYSRQALCIPRMMKFGLEGAIAMPETDAVVELKKALGKIWASGKSDAILLVTALDSRNFVIPSLQVSASLFSCNQRH